MEFNDLIHAKLSPILKDCGFDLIVNVSNRVVFQSGNLKMNISFNEREKSYFIEVGNPNGRLYPLNDKFLKNVLHVDLSVEQVTSNRFVENISLLFHQPEGVDLLNGNIQDLVDFTEKESREYTLGLIHQQALLMAQKKWEANDYTQFIKIIDELASGNIPESYKLKYKMAKERIA